MSTISRRRLLARTGVGAAAAGIATAVPSLILSHRQHASAATQQPATAARQSVGAAQQPSTAAGTLAPPKAVPSIAYVRDAAKGEVVLMVGTREVVRTDPALVAYLGRCCDTPNA